LKAQGVPVPGNGENAEEWASKDKFGVVIETAGLNQAELAEYRRRKGLFIGGNRVQRQKNRVYAEPANKKPSSPVQVEAKYQMGRGRGRDFVGFHVPNSKFQIPNSNEPAHLVSWWIGKN
jgi:hypothetical protein